MVGSVHAKSHLTLGSELRPIYRYPGFQPFQDSDIDRQLFFGREAEKEQLLHKILAVRLVVLYAKSGMGKTSLLNAGIFESLRARRFIPLVIRLHEADKPLWEVFYQRIADEAQTYKKSGFVSDWFPGKQHTLWEYFKTVEFWSAGDELLTPVLILDQFEELFTRVSDHGVRKAFISQLSDLVRGRMPLTIRKRLSREDRTIDSLPTYSESPPELKTIIAIRESHYGQLQALARKIPEIFDNRFRLQPLNRENARRAITEPARKEIGQAAIDERRFTYSDDAVNQILDFLCSKTDLNESVAESVEPFQLQQLCRKIEHKARQKPDRRIHAGDLGGEAGMQRILQDFYNEEMAALPAKVRKKVQDLIENGLISPKGRIRIPLHGADIEARFGVADETLGHLIQRRLLRSEQKMDYHLYELSHDTLIEPILDSRDKRDALIEEKKKNTGVFLSLAAMVVAVALSVLLIYFYVLPSYYFKEGSSASTADEKIDALQKVVNTPGRFPTAHFELAKAFLDQGGKQDAQLAIENLEEAVRLDPAYREAHYLLANELSNQGRAEKAIVHYKKAIAIYADYFDAYFALGSLYLARGNQAAGIQQLNLAVERNPKRTRFYYKVAGVLKKHNLQDDVVRIYNKGIGNTPDDSGLHAALANELFQMRDYINAATHYEVSSKLDDKLSDNPNILQNLAFCYLKIGKYDLATATYEQAATRIKNGTGMPDPQKRQTLAQIYFFQGNALQENKKFSDAIEKYDRAIENHPEFTNAYQGKSQALQELGQAALAETYNESAKRWRSR